MSRVRAAEPASQPKPKADSEESKNSPAPHARQVHPDAHVERASFCFFRYRPSVWAAKRAPRHVLGT